MMKKTIYSAPIIAAAIASMLFSCVNSDKDLYDPSYTTSNPMGEDFTAPNGFDWKMVSTKTVTTQVKDEYEGQYYYTIEIYDQSPLNNSDASLLAKGVAKKNHNFTTALNLAQAQKGIYIKQIDPRGREEVYLFDVPENSDNLTCKLFYEETAVQSKALMTRSVSTRNVGFEKPSYTSIPSNAIEIANMVGKALQPDANYKITSDYTGTFKFDGNSGVNISTKVYVNAKWTIPAAFTFQNGIEIIVMDNGEISTSNNMSFVNNSMLTIMDKGIVNAPNATFSNGSPAGLRSWGTLAIGNALTLSSGASLYNKGTITSKSISINANSKIINDNKIEFEEDLNLPSDFSFDNNGEVYGKSITTKSNGVITNNNIMRFETISFTNSTINNLCSMEATTSFYENGATMNFTKGYLKAPTMNYMNGTINLNDGSMIEATSSTTLSGTIFNGRGTNPSMLKSPVITKNGGAFTYDGNLVVESDNHEEKSPSWNNFIVQNGACITLIGESKVVIETCTGTKNNGNEGNEPTNPEFPIVMDDNHSYSYLFEDMWPLYGDYDMNDIVMTIKHRKVHINNDNKVNKFEFSIDLNAVGATKAIGAAIMLDGVPASSITQAVEYGNNISHETFQINNLNIEAGQDYAVIPLFDEAHKMLGGNSYEQINTVGGNSQAIHKDVKNMTFTIEFNNPSLSADAFNINKLNVFIIVDGNSKKRKEIHVAGFQPTKLANTDLFGGNNDNSSVAARKYYISKNNLAWAILAPTQFKWPLEYVNINNAYPQFSTWVTSGGKENQHWWNDFEVKKVFQTNKN